MIRPIARSWWWASILTAASGAFLAAALTKCGLASLAPAGPEAFGWCSKLAGDGAMAAAHAWWFGVPTATWGLVFFAVVAALLALARLLEPESSIEALLAAELVVCAGAATSIALSIVQAWQHGTHCVLCFAIDATSILLWIAVHKSIGLRWRDRLRFVRASIAWFF